tara:strand:+ start:301 stop:501 length:201 start_codon:yes stop_codon:yes gene_type:complete
MFEQRLAGVYRRIDIGGRITDAEIVLLIKDYNLRLKELEEKINGLERTPTDRPRSNKVSKKEVPSS